MKSKEDELLLQLRKTPSLVLNVHLISTRLKLNQHVLPPGTQTADWLATVVPFEVSGRLSQRFGLFFSLTLTRSFL